jgi:superfamily II DNA/RNA helicase
MRAGSNSFLMTTFTELGVPRDIADALRQGGITAPFPIQEATIADGLAGRDICGRAPTGSGKTLSFSIPLAARAAKGKPHRPSALVLVPTRELAAQVAAVLQPLADVRKRSVATFYGGTNIARDQRRLRRGVDIAIACPGRLADLARRRDVDLRDVRHVVLDEADRMADMGFLPEVKRLLDMTSGDRQTLLFSATLDGDVDVLIRRYQNDPARHELVTAAEDRGDVRHFFWQAGQTQRLGVTRSIVEQASPAIVFTRTKHGADRLVKQLSREGVRAAAIHGNRSQNQRERALANFADGSVTTLVATDVAARGIHVDNVGVVLHFDPPETGKDYVHRSGRTGRAGCDGLVVTLVAPDKVGAVKAMQRSLSMRPHVESVALDDLGAGGGVQLDERTGDAGDSRSKGARPPKQNRGRKPGQGHRGGNGRPKHQARSRQPSRAGR